MPNEDTLRKCGNNPVGNELYEKLKIYFIKQNKKTFFLYFMLYLMTDYTINISIIMNCNVSIHLVKRTSKIPIF